MNDRDVAELLTIRTMIDTMLARAVKTDLPNLDTMIHTAAAQLPNPAPARQLMSQLNKQLTVPVAGRRFRALVEAAGYRWQRVASGNVYWRPSAPEL
jgi:hypothetical protein